MASDEVSTVAVLPIHPVHAQAILDGRKQVEFRRRRFGRLVDYVFLYATAPVQAVVGYFRVSHVEEASPSAIWSKYGSIGGISRDHFRRYYKGKGRAVAIGVERAIAFDEPWPLADVLETKAPPQSYVYVSSSILPELRIE